jgi:hypothetical protein
MADSDARPRYRREEGRACIDVRVEDVAQVFDDRDPMPFLERDLDDEVAAYVTECAADIGNEPLRVVLWAERSDLDETALATAFRNQFEWGLALRVGAGARTPQAAGLVPDRARRLRARGRAHGTPALGVRGLRDAVLARLSAERAARGPRRREPGGPVAPDRVVLYDVWPTLERRRLLERIRDTPMSLRLGERGVRDSTPGAAVRLV